MICDLCRHDRSDVLLSIWPNQTCDIQYCSWACTDCRRIHDIDIVEQRCSCCQHVNGVARIVCGAYVCQRCSTIEASQ